MTGTALDEQKYQEKQDHGGIVKLNIIVPRHNRHMHGIEIIYHISTNLVKVIFGNLLKFSSWKILS